MPKGILDAEILEEKEMPLLTQSSSADSSPRLVKRNAFM